MKETIVARRYAKSLLDLAVSKNTLEESNRDMELVLEVCRNNRDFRSLLKNPLIHADKKLAIMKAIFTGKITDVTLAFINIIVRKRREFYLEEIAMAFTDQYKEIKGITSAVVISAVGLDEKLRKEVISVVRRVSEKEVALEEKIDPSLIGGFVLRFGDVQYDTSIARNLNMYRMNFSKNLYQSKIWKK